MKNFLTTLVYKEDALDRDTIKAFLESDEKFGGGFVINMRSKPERLIESSNTLKKVGRSFIQFRAISGAKLLKAQEQEPSTGINLKERFNILRPGELGCLLSHLSVINLAAHHPNENNFTLIFEDDIVTSATSIQETLDHVSQIDEKEGVDIVYLGKCLEQCSQMTRLVDNVWRAVAPSCCHAYAIKNGFARKVMRDLDSCEVGAPNCDYFNRGIDSILGDYIINKESNGLVIHPALFMQDVLTTTSDLRPEFLHNYLECRDTVGRAPPHHEDHSETSWFSSGNKNPDILKLTLIFIVAIVILVLMTKFIVKFQKTSLYLIVIIVLVYLVLLTLYISNRVGCSAGGRVEGKKITIESFQAPNLSSPSESKTLKVEETNLMTKAYKAFNPNAVLKDGKIVTAFRVSNGKVSYPLIEVRDENMKILKSQRVELKTDRKVVDYDMPLGFEDMRIFEHQGSLGLIGVNLDRNESGLPSMVVSMLDENLKAGSVIHLTYPPLSNKPNKNWAPISLEGGDLGYVVNIDPLLIVKQVTPEGLCEAVVEGTKAFELPPIRNSSVTLRGDQIPQPYREELGIGDGKSHHVMMVHTKYVESDFKKDGKLVQYQHYIAIIEVARAKITLSKPFHVEQPDKPHIEYVSGFVFDPSGEMLVMYGLRDEESKYFHLPARNLKALMRKD